MHFFSPLFRVGRVAPTKIDYREKLVPTYSDLSTGGPSLFDPLVHVDQQKVGSLVAGYVTDHCHAGRKRLTCFVGLSLVKFR